MCLEDLRLAKSRVSGKPVNLNIAGGTPQQIIGPDASRVCLTLSTIFGAGAATLDQFASDRVQFYIGDPNGAVSLVLTPLSGQYTLRIEDVGDLVTKGVYASAAYVAYQPFAIVQPTISFVNAPIIPPGGKP